LNIAMGGVAGTIPTSFTNATMEIDYVRVYQNTLVDTQAPTNFTATVGVVTGSSIELLLNATDNSGNVVYTITYGSNTITLANASGVQKSVVIPNLAANTTYNFTVSASDLAGNAAANNPITVTSSTLATLGCSGTNTAAQIGTFSAGYNYSFETIGTSVKITFQLLDTDKVGVVAFLWRQSPFTEFPMTNVSGNSYTYTITGQTIGATISYAVKFAYAGGLSVTNYFTYLVGDNCILEVPTVEELDQFSFQNPVVDYLNISSRVDIDQFEIYSMLGHLMVRITTDFNQINVQHFSEGVYLVAVYSGNKKSIKKMVVK
ncbi:MAG: T9SS type A sorting domain-containing protein, partial [Candidatus Paceibacterota bacterium]